MLVFSRVPWLHYPFLQHGMLPLVGEPIWAHDLKYHIYPHKAQIFISGPVLFAEFQNSLKDIPACLVPQELQSQHVQNYIHCAVPRIAPSPLPFSLLFTQRIAQASNLSVILNFMFPFASTLNHSSCSDRLICLKWLKSLHVSSPALSPPRLEYN